MQHETDARDGAQWALPPRLAGYGVDAPSAYKARDDGRLLSLWMETSGSCSLRCVYCAGTCSAPDADPAVLAQLLRQARDMGCESVCLSSRGGDPLRYPGFAVLVERIESLGMIPVVMTSGLDIPVVTAAFLHEHRASVMIKMDSFSEPVQDMMAGTPGAYKGLREGFCRLLEAGFGLSQGAFRLGAAFTLTRSNAREAVDFWRFCRAYRIVPEVRVRQAWGEHAPGRAESAHILAHLREIDRGEYGFDWNSHSPLPGAGCLRFLYSMYVTRSGDVRPCSDTALELHPAFRKNGEYPLNVRRMSLRDIYHSGPMYYCRHIDSFLEGKCRSCSAASQCIGCRGRAFEEGLDEGMGPLQALASGCRHCIK